MECSGSHLPGSCLGPATLRCGSCGAVGYCSRQHQKRHWREHAQVCARMAVQMQRAPELYDFPFSFTDQTTRLLEAEETTACSLFESWGLHGAGLWTASCGCLEIAEGAVLVNGDWNLPPRACPCRPPENPPPSEFQSWEAFYKWRGLPLDSPVALILHWPLSLYHAVCVSRLQIRNLMSLRAHYLGPERELKQLSAFAELLALFPGVLIHIDFIGPAVPLSLDGESLKLIGFCRCSDVECTCKDGQSGLRDDGVSMRFWRGLYHDRLEELGAPPDLIFAANAGVAAFSSWHPTLRLMESLAVPAVFTDYCEEAAVLAVQTIQHVGLGMHRGLAIPVQVNPFRQPLSSKTRDLNLPTFSNAFTIRINGPVDAT